MKKIWIFIGVLVAVIIFVSWKQWGKPANATLTKQEAENLVQNRYQGTVEKIIPIDQQFQIELAKENKLYEIKLNAESGEVLSFVKIKDDPPIPEQSSSPEFTEEEIKSIILSKTNGTIISFEKLEGNTEMMYRAVVQELDKQTSITVGAISGNILSSTTINEPPKTITETEAVQIAETQVNGTIDDLVLETRGDVTYYLAEVKTADDREAIVQIHTITGQVMSVTWDDHKDEDDDHE